MEDWSQHRWSEAANWLRTREASQWLDDPAPTERMLRRMQRELAEWQIILVIALRETACRVPQKFPTHPNLLATPLALEQASDWGIAAYKAVRFAGRPVVDMCCGMGGDLVALALQHRAENGTCHGLMGVEQNPLLAVVAAENVRRVTGCDVEVRNESCLETRTGDWWLHIDPDRRPNFESRVSRTELYQPSWQQLLPLIAASPGGGVKIAPAAELDSTEWDSPELDTCDAPTSADWER